MGSILVVLVWDGGVEECCTGLVLPTMLINSAKGMRFGDEVIYGFGVVWMSFLVNLLRFVGFFDEVGGAGEMVTGSVFGLVNTVLGLLVIGSIRLVLVSEGFTLSR